MEDLFTKSTAAEQFETDLREKKDIQVVCPCGRTLAEILSLSYPKNSSRYSFTDVHGEPGRGKGGKGREKSRGEADGANQRTELKKAELKEELERWQISNLVAHGTMCSTPFSL